MSDSGSGLSIGGVLLFLVALCFPWELLVIGIILVAVTIISMLLKYAFARKSKIYPVVRDFTPNEPVSEERFKRIWGTPKP